MHTTWFYNKEEFDVIASEMKLFGEAFYILLMIGCNTPYKSEELFFLKIQDVCVLKEKKIFVKKLSIGGMEVELPLWLKEEVEKYIENNFGNEYKGSEYLFQKKGKALTKEAFRKNLYRIRKKYDIKTNYGISSMRKTFFRKMYEEQGEEYTIKMLKMRYNNARKYLDLD